MPPWGRSTFKSVRRSLQTEPTVASLRQQITSSGRGKLCFRASLGDDPDPGQPLGVPHLIARLSPRSPFCELAAAQQRNNKTAANTSRTLSISAILSATPSRSTTVETRQPCRRTMEQEKKRKARQTNETTPPPPPTHKSPSPEGRREPRRDRDVYRSVAPDEATPRHSKSRAVPVPLSRSPRCCCCVPHNGHNRLQEQSYDWM